MKVFKITRTLTYIYIIAFAVCLEPTFDKTNRNILLVCVMMISPVIIFYYNRIRRSDLPLILFIAALVVFPLLMNPSSMRWSTVLYSCLFCLSFMAYKRLLLSGYFSKIDYEKLLRLLIYSYVITLVIQQLGVLTGLPVLNLRFYNPAEPWKLNSLGAEPSWAGRILGILMYSYICIKEINSGGRYDFVAYFKGEDRWLWIGFIWTMLSMGSATAVLFLGLVLLKLIHFRNLIPLILVVLVLIYIAEKNNMTSVDRTKNTILATLTLNEKRIVEADHSASFRIVSIITLAKMLDFTRYENWFGHGVDYIQTHVDLKIPGSKGMAGGGSLSIAIEYGLISFILYMFISLYSTINTKDINSFIFWFILIFSYGLNVQIPWLAMMLLYTNNYFAKSVMVYRRNPERLASLN